MRLRSSFLISALGLLLIGCSEESPEDDGTVVPPVLVDEIDLVVDANRDGIANLDDPEDQANEGLWTGAYGAAFLPNIDDDDANKVADASDTIVNGDNDAFDLARINIRPWPKAPAGATATLKVDDFAVPHVRIYRLNAGAWQLVAGAMGPCGLNGDVSCPTEALKLTQADLVSGVELGIEGRYFAGSQDARRANESIGLLPGDARCTAPERPISLSEACTWTGMVEIQLQGTNANGAPIVTKGNPTDGIDRALLRVSPWVANHNMRAFNQVHFLNYSNALVTTLPPALQEFGVAPMTYPNTPDSGGDIWYEDWMQTGYAAMPSQNGLQGFEVFNPRPWGRPNTNSPTPAQIIAYQPLTFLRATFLGPDRAVAVFWDEGPSNLDDTQKVTQAQWDAGDSYDSHGNHDALPPSTDFPMGRIITGSGVLETTKTFYWSQVQHPIHVNTSFLVVGHIDEVLSPVASNSERGWRLLINTPSLGRSMFQQYEMDGQGAAVVFPGKGASWQTTVAEINADTVLQTWNQEAQVNVDAIRAQLIAESGLTDADFLEIPVLYEEVGGGKIAYLPDTANVRVIQNGSVGIFAKTQGPMINGEDAMKTYLETFLGDPAQGLGPDGQGLIVRFGDSWDYHVALGDIHCASNWTGPPVTTEPLWWSAFP